MSTSVVSISISKKTERSQGGKLTHYPTNMPLTQEWLHWKKFLYEKRF